MPMNGLGIHQMYPVSVEDRPLSEVAGSYTYFADGDVLLAKITPCFENGKLGVARGLTNGVGFGSSEFHVLRPSSEVLAEYVYYFLERDVIRERGAKAMTGAVGHRRVPEEFLERLEIPVPPLEEQRRIVAVLDEAFAAIATATANAERNIVNARELFERASSALLNSEDWNEAALGDLCEISSKLVDPRLDEYVDLPHIGAGNIESRTGALSNVLTARQEGLISGKFLFDPSMVLYSKIRPYLMKVCRPDFAGLCSADVYPLAPVEGKLDRDFLFSVLLSQDFTAYAEAGSARAGMPKVNRDHLFAYQLKLPPLEIQREIATKIDLIAESCGEIASGYEAKLVHLAGLKQSLLNQAFAGELTERTAMVHVGSNDNFATPEFAANIVALAYERHVAKNRVRNFGTVKAEKILHLVEAVGGIDLGRKPIRQAAGPDDAQHRHATWDWARSHSFFKFEKRNGGGHDFLKLPAYAFMIAGARKAVARAGPSVANAIELLVDMDKDFAELVATTYAAWNNLILDGAAITDELIVRTARDDWHEDKLRFDPSRFHDAIRFIRTNNFVPNGSAKRVGGQEQLAL